MLASPKNLILLLLWMILKGSSKYAFLFLIFFFLTIASRRIYRKYFYVARSAFKNTQIYHNKGINNRITFHLPSIFFLFNFMFSLRLFLWCLALILYSFFLSYLFLPFLLIIRFDCFIFLFFCLYLWFISLFPCYEWYIRFIIFLLPTSFYYALFLSAIHSWFRSSLPFILHTW